MDKNKGTSKNNFCDPDNVVKAHYRIWILMKKGEIFSQQQNKQSLKFYSHNSKPANASYKYLVKMFTEREQRIERCRIYDNQTGALLEILK